MNVGILGIAYELPGNVVSNEDLGQENPDWRLGDIYEKTGISSRRVTADSETASDLGYKAATALLSQAIINPTEIDYILFCTQSPDHFLPSGACILQDRLQLGTHVGSFDFNLGCSGYVYGLQMAKALVTSGSARNVLLITADTYSKYIHPRDRTVRTLFGDGAAATLVGPSKGTATIGEFVVGTDGSGANSLIVIAGGLRTPHSPATAEESTDDSGCTRSEDNLFMDGPAVFAFAITTVPRLVRTLLNKLQVSVEDIDWFVYHQANKYMLEQLARRNKIPMSKMVVDVEHIGNTVSSSIPIAIQRGVDSGHIKPGHRLILVGFGVGYSWGACDITWA